MSKIIDFQGLVLQFHKAFEIDHADSPTPQYMGLRLLRARLAFEETMELIEALGCEVHLENGKISIKYTADIEKLSRVNLKQIAHELMDNLYVTFGTCVAFGIDSGLLFGEIHAANMRKLFPDGKPHKREDGKVLKPDGYVGPDVSRWLHLMAHPQDASAEEVMCMEPLMDPQYEAAFRRARDREDEMVEIGQEAFIRARNEGLDELAALQKVIINTANYVLGDEGTAKRSDVKILQNRSTAEYDGAEQCTQTMRGHCCMFNLGHEGDHSAKVNGEPLTWTRTGEIKWAPKSILTEMRAEAARPAVKCSAILYTTNTKCEKNDAHAGLHCGTRDGLAVMW